MRRPEFVTFTGADDETDVDGMLALSRRYPVEWGILMSLKRVGVPRYPRDHDRFLRRGLRLAAHLCGGFSRDIMSCGAILGHLPHDVFDGFGRVQVNHPEPSVQCIALFGDHVRLPCIAQARGKAFPTDESIAWLFDASCGRGAKPPSWPAHPGGDRLVGYAGGIGPENVRDVIAAIDSTGPYWLDMESGVRTDDRFDLEKCRAVCEAVFGSALAGEAKGR